MSVVRFKLLCNILISGKIIKEMPGSVTSGTPYISDARTYDFFKFQFLVTMHRVHELKRENQQDATNSVFIIKLLSNMFRASLCPSSGE